MSNTFIRFYGWFNTSNPSDSHIGSIYWAVILPGYRLSTPRSQFIIWANVAFLLIGDMFQWNINQSSYHNFDTPKYVSRCRKHTCAIHIGPNMWQMLSHFAEVKYEYWNFDDALNQLTKHTALHLITSSTNFPHQGTVLLRFDVLSAVSLSELLQMVGLPVTP